MSKHRITPEVREQIINRVKNDGVNIKQVALEHGITDSAIYKWLGKGVEGVPSLLEYAKLKRENDELLMLASLTPLSFIVIMGLSMTHVHSESSSLPLVYKSLAARRGALGRMGIKRASMTSSRWISGILTASVP